MLSDTEAPQRRRDERGDHVGMETTRQWKHFYANVQLLPQRRKVSDLKEKMLIS